MPKAQTTMKRRPKVGRPKSQNADQTRVPLYMRIDPALLTFVDARAEVEGRSRSNMIERCIQSYRGRAISKKTKL